MKERKIRVGPWDCDEKLLDRVSLYRAQQGGKPWTWVLHKALREMMDREQVFIGAHADNVESVSNPAFVSTAPAVVAASGVPVSVGTQSSTLASALPVAPAAGVAAAGEPINGSTNEKRLYWLLKSRARTQECLDAAPIELEKDPKSLRALNWLARMPGILEKQDAEIEACKAAIEAERLAKEKTGASEAMEEV